MYMHVHVHMNVKKDKRLITIFHSQTQTYGKAILAPTQAHLGNQRQSHLLDAHTFENY